MIPHPKLSRASSRALLWIVLGLGMLVASTAPPVVATAPAHSATIAPLTADRQLNVQTLTQSSTSTFYTPPPPPTAAPLPEIPLPAAPATASPTPHALAAVHLALSGTGALNQPLLDGCTWAPWVAQCSMLTVYGNGSNLGNMSCGPPYGCTYGPEFQCTELVLRYAHFAIGEPDRWGGDAATFWDAGPTLPIPLQQFPNGGGTPPMQGDILVFNSGWLGSYYDGPGHVAVIRDVGPNYVDIVQQNATPTGTDRLPMNGTTLSANGYTPIIGWLRNTKQVPVRVAGSNMAGTPVSVSDRPGNSDALWRGSDNALWTVSYRNNRWGTTASSVSITNVASDPTAISTTSGTIDAFYRGTDGNLWHLSYKEGFFGSGTWSAPSSTGIAIASAPHAIANGSTAYIFWKSSTGLLDFSRYVSGGSISPLPIAGTSLASDPIATTYGNGGISVFWRDPSGALGYVPMSIWGSGHATLLTGAGTLTSDPAAGGTASGTVSAFWRGADGTLWAMSQSSGSWSAPASVAAQQIVGNPTAVGLTNGNITVDVEGTDANLYAVISIPSVGFVGPEQLGDGPVASSPSEMTPQSDAAYVFWRGSDNALWYSPACSGCGAPPTVLGEPLG